MNLGEAPGRSLRAPEMFRAPVSLVAAALVVALACPMAAASTVLYQTGFEPPEFSVGPLNGKNGWETPAAANVQTTTVRSGVQALSIPATGLSPFQFANRWIVYQRAGNPESLVRVSVEMLLSPDGVPASWDPIFISGSSGFLTQLNVFDGVARLGLASTSVGSVPVARGVWNTFVVELDHQQHIVTAYVNGTFLGSGPFAGVSPNVTNYVAFGVVGVGSDTASFDNLSITSVSPVESGRTFTHFAGSDGAGAEDGTGSAARFNRPNAVATDSSGNVYVADTINHTIRKVDPSGEVTTLAGVAGERGSVDGPGGEARFFSPSGVAADGAGNVYVSDTYNHTIRKITPDGVVTTLAGVAGQSGSAEGAGSAARFSNPWCLAVDGAGNLYVAEPNLHRIRKITPGGMVTTLAGDRSASGSADGTGSTARFRSPYGVATDISGNVYVSDAVGLTIRKITPGGVVTTLAGADLQPGGSDGTGSAARFQGPAGIACDGSGNVYVMDTGNLTVRRITPAGVVTTLAGLTRTQGTADGTGSAARFFYPSGLAAGPTGELFVADTGASTIRKIANGAAVTTLAGFATPGSADGTGTAAQFNGPRGIAVDGNGNAYVADFINRTIRKISPGGAVTTLAGSPGQSALTDGTGSAARFAAPGGVAVDPAGNVYVSEGADHTIRKITSAGVVTTFAGKAGESGSANGAGGAARFRTPVGLAADTAGNVYVADANNQTIRKISSGGVVSTLAGAAGQPGATDGIGTAARFYLPFAVATDPAGNVYVTEGLNAAVRKITPGGVVTTLAGSAAQTGSADGTGSAARFGLSMFGVAADGGGNVYVSDSQNYTIRRITPAGVVTTVAGVAGVRGAANGEGSAARFESAVGGLAVDQNGAVYFADSSNHTVRVGRAVLPDVATVNSDVGFVGEPSQFLTSPDTASSWLWSVIRRPSGSVAALSSNSVRNPTFVPDRTGLFIVRLIAAGGGRTSTTTAKLDVVQNGTYTIAITSGTGGTASGGGTFPASRRTVTATASPGYGFTGWTEGDSVVSTAAEYSFALGANRSLVANFTRTDFTITVMTRQFGGGTASGAGTFTVGSVRTVTATPDSGYQFVKWAEYGKLASSSATYTFTLDGDRVLEPTFIALSSGVQGLTFRSYAGRATGGSGFDDPRFQFPSGVAVDGSGNLFVVEPGHNYILKVTPAGVITTFAGNGQAGSNDGTGSEARFHNPFSLATDKSGNVYVADVLNQTIRKITPAGKVTTLAGLAGQEGSVNGTGSAARFSNPDGVAVDASGNLFVTEETSHTIRRITPGGVVTTVAGAPYQAGSVDGAGSAARFNIPAGVAIDKSGNLFVTDLRNHTIRKITPGGSVTTIAGLAGQRGSADGTGSAARFSDPAGIAIDSAANLYVGDRGNQTIRRITPAGVVTTVAGLAGQAGSADGTGPWARFNLPMGIAVDAGDNLYVADFSNVVVRKGGPSIPDAAIIDVESGPAGDARQLLTNPDTAASWQWRVLERPAGSVAALSSLSVRNPTFTPDKGGQYTFELVATRDGTSSVTTVDLDVPASGRKRAVRH